VGGELLNDGSRGLVFLNSGGQRNFDLRGIGLWLINFGEHLIAIVLDQQPLIPREWSIHSHTRYKMLTSHGKFMYLV